MRLRSVHNTPQKFLQKEINQLKALSTQKYPYKPHLHKMNKQRSIHINIHGWGSSNPNNESLAHITTNSHTTNNLKNIHGYNKG